MRKPDVILYEISAGGFLQRDEDPKVLVALAEFLEADQKRNYFINEVRVRPITLRTLRSRAKTAGAFTRLEGTQVI